jgi:diguanylate cyclase (GGDEF)-like protein/PAS domain S-box-containing protein
MSDTGELPFQSEHEVDWLVQQLENKADGLLFWLLRNDLVGIFIIHNRRFRYVNRRFADIFGYAQDELCSGMGPMDLVRAEQRQAAEQEFYFHLHNSPAKMHYPFQGMHKNGRDIHTELFAATGEFEQRLSIVGMLIDHSERHKAQVDLEEQFHLIRQLIDTIPSPVFYKDEAGRYLGCNIAFEKFTGQLRQELVGKSVHDLFPPELADRYFSADKELFDNPGIQTYEAVVQSADRGRRDVVFNKATFNKSAGQLGGLVGVILDITDRRKTEEKIRRLALYDIMTDLPNRTLFMDRLKQSVSTVPRNGLGLVVLFMDLNRFKEINDTQGHAAGDQVLVDVARRFQSVLRGEETLARLGGDEFVVAAEVSELRTATLIAERMQHTLAAPVIVNGRAFSVGVSIGIACYPVDALTAEDLLKCADIAMYHAKSSGGGSFFYAPHMGTGVTERMEIGLSLAHAIEHGILELHYQPKIRLDTGLLDGAEALLRWNRGERGWLGPKEFIPIAEERNLMNRLGTWIMREACRQLKEWQNSHTPLPGRLAINITAHQLEQPDFSAEIQRIVYDAGLTPQCFELELTESGLMTNIEWVIKVTAELKAVGFILSIDDFGTGYSSLAYLKKLPANTLKIDVSFVSDMLENAQDYSIVTTIIGMARNFGIESVAEGVESLAQAEVLRELGCNMAQGNYFGYPEAAPAFAKKWLMSGETV